MESNSFENKKSFNKYDVDDTEIYLLVVHLSF
jgi:hypothetical protein